MNKQDFINSFLFAAKGVNVGLKTKKSINSALSVYRRIKKINRINYNILTSYELLCCWNIRFTK